MLTLSPEVKAMGSRRYQSPGNVLLESFILSWVCWYTQTWLKTISCVHRPFRGLLSIGCLHLSTESLLHVIMYVRKPWHKWFRTSSLPFLYPFPINKKSWTRKNCNSYRSTNTLSVSPLKQKIRILNYFFLAFEGAWIFLNILWKRNLKFRPKVRDIFFGNSWPLLQRMKTQADASN